MTKHIPTPQLALYSRGDVGFWQRKLVERHLDRCEECAGAVVEFVQVQASIGRSTDHMPAGVNWESMASEMTANIRLGLAAGECVSATAPRKIFFKRPRLSFALAGLTVAAVVVAMEHPALHHSPVAVPAQATLEASGDEVMVQNGDRGLSVSAPAGIDVVRTVSSRGAVRSRYVDNAGVTIVNVYAE